MGILIGILILSLLVFVHELGHFLFAKRAGVRVETFSIGFGPKLLKRTIGETEYCISAVLFGGYVKMTGQDDMGHSGEKTPDEKDYRNKSIFQRVQIAFAGPLFNYLLALVALTALYSTGLRETPELIPVVGHVADSSSALVAGFQVGDTLLSIDNKRVSDWDGAIMEFALHPEKTLKVGVGRAAGRIDLLLIPRKTGREGIGSSGLYRTEIVVLGDIVKGSPAEKAGLRKNDTLLQVNGRNVPGWDFVVEKIMAAESSAVALEVKRGAEAMPISVTPVFSAENKRYMIGIQRGAVFVERRYPVPQAFGKALSHTANDAFMIWKFLKAIVTTQVSVKGMAGPVGIIHITGQVARGGFDLFLLFLAMISVNLAVVNLFPFLIITDGGVIFFLLLEAVRGKPLSERNQMRIQQTAIVAIVALFLLLTWNDIFRLVGGKLMPNIVLLTGLADPVASRIRTLAGENGFKVEIARDRDECQEFLLNQEILALIIHASMVEADSRIIEVMKFYSNSVQFIVYSEAGGEEELSGLPRSDIIGVLIGEKFPDNALTDFLGCAVRLGGLEKKVESLNFALQENHSTASELNLKNTVLERERNFNTSIINSIAYGLMITDTDSAIMLINEVGKRIFGITAPDYYGMNYESVVFEGIKENLAQNAREILKSGKSVAVEGFTVRDDLIISYTLSVIKDHFGNVIGLMFLGRDVTEWENMTHQLFQAEKLATMGTMLSGIAHELRNPVTIINARAQRLLQSAESPLTDKVKKAVESIENQSKRCGTIINNLLDFSRRSVAGFGLADVNEIIDVALNFLVLEGRSQGIEIIKNYGENCTVKCDRNQMEQVLLNLFTNACDAMQNAGKLFLTTENSENYIRISVRDTGSGIPEELKKKIFDPFFTTKEAGKGTGLGLAIVYKIIQAHKGRLVVRSKVGQGTTFIIMLPKGQ